MKKPTKLLIAITIFCTCLILAMSISACTEQSYNEQLSYKLRDTPVKCLYLDRGTKFVSYQYNPASGHNYVVTQPMMAMDTAITYTFTVYNPDCTWKVKGFELKIIETK